MSQVTAMTTNTVPITGSATEMQSNNIPPRSPASSISSSIYSTASDTVPPPSSPLPSTPKPPTGTVALSLRELYFRSRFSFEFAQKLHRRQLLFFWRKKKHGLLELRASLQRNVEYFARYDEIAVEAPGLALRIGEVDEEFGREVSSVLAVADGRMRTLRCEGLARSSDKCRAQVEGLLEEGRKAVGGVEKEVVVPQEITMPKEEETVVPQATTEPKEVKEAAVPKTEQKTTLPENTGGAKPTVREVKVPNEIFIPKRRRTPQAQNVERASVSEKAQGGDTTTPAENPGYPT